MNKKKKVSLHVQYRNMYDGNNLAPMTATKINAGDDINIILDNQRYSVTFIKVNEGMVWYRNLEGEKKFVKLEESNFQFYRHLNY